MAYSPTFQLYYKDFLSDANTIRMNAAEVGAYFLLILECWDKDNAIPNDPDALADVARMPVEEFKVVWSRRLSRCFVLNEKKNVLTHKRVAKEILSQKKWKKKKSNDGLKGALKRWGQKSKSDSHPIGTHGDPMGNNASSSSSSSSSSFKKKVKKKAPVTIEEMIQTFKADPFYTGVDVVHEFEKMERWISRNLGRKLTKRFAENWMDKADRVIETNGTGTSGAKPDWQVAIDNCSKCDPKGVFFDENDKPKVCKHN